MRKEGNRPLRTAECVLKILNLVKEVAGLSPKAQYAEDMDRTRTRRIPRTGNFSFYPTLFIASQEMFVNSDFNVPNVAQVHSGFRPSKPHHPVVR